MAETRRDIIFGPQGLGDNLEIPFKIIVPGNPEFQLMFEWQIPAIYHPQATNSNDSKTCYFIQDVEYRFFRSVVMSYFLKKDKLFAKNTLDNALVFSSEQLIREEDLVIKSQNEQKITLWTNEREISQIIHGHEIFPNSMIEGIFKVGQIRDYYISKDNEIPILNYMIKEEDFLQYGFFNDLFKIIQNYIPPSQLDMSQIQLCISILY